MEDMTEEAISNEDYVLTIRKEDYDLGELAPTDDQQGRSFLQSRSSIDSTIEEDRDQSLIEEADYDLLVKSNGAKVSTVFQRRLLVSSSSTRKLSSKLMLSRGVLARAKRQACHYRSAFDKLKPFKMSTVKRQSICSSNESLEVEPRKNLNKTVTTTGVGKNQSHDLKPENIVITCIGNSNNNVKDTVAKVEAIKPKLKLNQPRKRIEAPSPDGKSIRKPETKISNDKNPSKSKERVLEPSVRSKRDRSPVLESSSKNQRKPEKSPELKLDETESPYDPFFKDTRYFMVKSCNEENVILSKVKGVWATTPRNERLFNKAYRRHQNVILVFSVEKSQAFQGFCRMISESAKGGTPVNWVLPRSMNVRALGGVFRVQWLNRSDLPFNSVSSRLYNRWNSNKPVKIARDGTEIEPSTGVRLCRQFPHDSSVDLHDAVLRQRERRLRHAASSSGDAASSPITRPLTPPIVPMGTARTLNSRAAPMTHHHAAEMMPPRRFPPPPERRLPPLSPRRHTPPIMSRRPTFAPPPARRFGANDTRRFGANDARRFDANDRCPRGGMRPRRPMDSDRHNHGYKDLLINGSYSDYMREYSSSTPSTYHYPSANNTQPQQHTFPSIFSTLPATYAYSASEAAAYGMYMNYVSNSQQQQYFDPFSFDRNGKSAMMGRARLEDVDRRSKIRPNFDFPLPSSSTASDRRRPFIASTNANSRRRNSRSRSRSPLVARPAAYQNHNNSMMTRSSPMFVAKRRAERTPSEAMPSDRRRRPATSPPPATHNGREYRRR